MKINFKKISRNFKQFLLDRVERVAIPSGNSGTRNRQRVNYLFRLRDRIFFRKKKPVSEAYPFTVVDPFEIFGENHPYGDFNLVGDKWHEKSTDTPVAILWGFNNWKWGFVSNYLPEYRTAFAPRKILSLRSLQAIRRFPLTPSAFIFWGYTEPWLVRWYASRKNIKIFRMEDGFIRSSSLGASHSTPYSLLLDAKGLHYNPEEPSDLEEILNYHSFSEKEIEAAKECMALMKDLRLSKYNPATLNTENPSVIKIRKRVVVLGQVDNDMSVRLGNPDRWSMVELIRLAKIENPDAEILYRPHPDVFKGYQKSRFRQRAVEKFCQISSPDIPIVDFLETVDHVYTITSLSGLEALLKGKKVTVVGAAFYAGWGLTDDRLMFPRRTTKRTLLELFAGIYLKYPRYLANLEDNEIGLQAACFRIKADLEIETYDLANSQTADTEQSIRSIAKSDYWPVLLFRKQTNENESSVQKSIEQIDFEKLLAVQPGRMFQVVLIYAMCGICKSNTSRNSFLSRVRNYIDQDIFNLLLLDLSRHYPGEYIASQFAWLLTEAEEYDVTLEVLTTELVRSQEASRRLIQEANERVNDDQYIDPTVPPQPAERLLLSRTQADLLMEIFDHNVSVRKIEEAIEVGKRLLLTGFCVSKIIQKMAQLSVIKFDRYSARCIAKFSQCADLYDQNRMSVLIETNNFTETCVSRDPLDFILSLVKLIALKPDRINDAVFLVKKYSDYCDNTKLEALFTSLLMLDNEQSIRKASSYIAIEKPQIAVTILENLIKERNDSDHLRIAYSQALSYAGRLEEALEIMESARKLQKTSANYRETLRLFVLTGMYDRSFNLLKDAQNRKIELGDMHPRKIYFGCRMVKEAFETFTMLSIKKTIATYYPGKYFYTRNMGSSDGKLLLLAIFGPGDEIRFASIYNLLQRKLFLNTLSISCSPRLLSLFERSFSAFNFVPVSRPRNSDLIDLRNYSNVLGSDLTGVIDNTATEAINNSDHVMLVTDMLHECLPTYEAFPGTPYLKHDSLRAARYQKSLPNDTKLVGLSWRSSLTTHSRNEHYLTVEELEPIFRIDELQFVNFQYDECQAELDWIETRYPGKVINISEIDHYNDFDSVAALMKCMDLMIAPATTVVELSGALGCPTWLLSNSSELHWRKIDQRGTDVWHNCITHIEGAVLGDKSTLVDQLCTKLLEFSTTNSHGSITDTDSYQAAAAAL